MASSSWWTIFSSSSLTSSRPSSYSTRYFNSFLLYLSRLGWLDEYHTLTLAPPELEQNKAFPCSPWYAKKFLGKAFHIALLLAELHHTLDVGPGKVSGIHRWKAHHRNRLRRVCEGQWVLNTIRVANFSRHPFLNPIASNNGTPIEFLTHIEFTSWALVGIQGSSWSIWGPTDSWRNGTKLSSMQTTNWWTSFHTWLKTQR